MSVPVTQHSCFSVCRFTFFHLGDYRKQPSPLPICTLSHAKTQNTRVPVPRFWGALDLLPVCALLGLWPPPFCGGGEGSADSSGVVRPASHSVRTCKWYPGTECHRAWAQAKLLTLGGCLTELSFRNPQLKPGHLALESGLHSGFRLSVLADLVQVGSDAFSYIRMCKQALKLRPRCNLVGCEQRYGCICAS